MNRNKRKIRNTITSAVLLLCMILTCFSSVSNATTPLTPEEQFRQLYLRLLETGDHSQQDITDLNLPYMTCYDIMQDVKENEGYLACQCYENYCILQLDQYVTIDKVTYLQKFHLGETEDTGFLERYTKIKEIIANMKNSFDDKMSDLDKLLWINEYIVENVTYKNTNSSSDYLAVPTLLNGYGVCSGYARLMVLFLKECGIPCRLVSGGDHAWVAVNIDGKWYHADPTWDDTRAWSGGTHYFLMRNDDEFRNTLSSLHTWTDKTDFYTGEVSTTISTSTDYTDWYVHNVRNRMYYYDGYWYYILDKAVRKNNINGTDETIICEGNNLSIKGIENGTLTYSVGSEEKQLVLKNDDTEKDSTEASTEKSTEGEKTTEISTEKPSEAEKTTEVSTEKPSEAEKTTEISTERPSEAEKTTEISTEKPATTEKTTQASTENTTTTEKTTEVSTEKETTTVKATQASTEKATTTEKATQASTEKPATTEKATQASTEKTTEIDNTDADEDWDVDNETSSSSQKAKSRIPVIKSVTNKKGNKVKIVLKKKIAGADGYELVYSTDKKFKKSVKKVNFKGTSKTISKLRKNKIYYIKVRAYKKNASGKKVYSYYSNIKKVKIKK